MTRISPPLRVMADAHLDVGLVDEPTVTRRSPSEPGRVGQQRREPLHPPMHGDVINLHTTLGQQFLDIAMRQPALADNSTPLP